MNLSFDNRTQAVVRPILMSIVEKVRAKTNIMDDPIALLPSASFLILMAWLWVGILLDQMPCFLGVPNCD
jgi:hypothetical protein